MKKVNISKTKLLLCLASFFGVLLDIAIAFAGDFTSILTVFIMPFFIFVVVATLILIMLLSIITKNGISFAIGSLTFVIAILLFLSNAHMWIDFYTGLDKRTEVIEMIQSNGDLYSGFRYKGNTVELTEEFKSVSNGGGEVIIQQDDNGNIDIMFFVIRGITGDYSAFVYLAEDREFENGFPEGDFDEVFSEVIKIRDHWYYVVSN